METTAVQIQEDNSQKPEETNQIRFNKILLEYAGYSWVLLVLAGLLKGIVYYHHFGIQITSFLSISEILIYFLGDIYILLPIGLQAYLYYDFHVMILKRFKESGVSRKRLISVLSFSSGILVVLLVLFFYFQFTDVAMAPLILVTYLVLTSLMRGLLKNDFYGPFSSKKLYHVVCAAGLLSLFALMGASEIHCVNKNRVSSVILQLKNADTIKTTNDLRFLGKTGEYYFFYKMKNKNAIIIPASEVAGVGIGGN